MDCADLRAVPAHVVAAVDLCASRLGLSRREYVRRRLAQDAAAGGSAITAGDLARFADVFGDLADRRSCRRPGGDRLDDRQVRPRPAWQTPDAARWARSGADLRAGLRRAPCPRCRWNTRPRLVKTGLSRFSRFLPIMASTARCRSLTSSSPRRLSSPG